jgi:hypothetical protein
MEEREDERLGREDERLEVTEGDRLEEREDERLEGREDERLEVRRGEKMRRGLRRRIYG